jgi:hypothetical protein
MAGENAGAGADVPPDIRWLTYEEAAHLLGVDPDSVARRARRLQWRKQPGNDGRVRVAIPADILPDVADMVPDKRADRTPDRSQVINDLEQALLVATERAARAEGEAAARREELDRLLRERDAERTERVAAQAEASALRAERDAAHSEAATREEEVERLISERAHGEAEAAKLREEAAGLATRAAVAETEAKGLREALAEARRPFWRRWIG